MTTFKYKGIEFARQGKILLARPDYPAAVHKGYPVPFQPIAENVESSEQAAKQAEDYIAAIDKK